VINIKGHVTLVPCLKMAYLKKGTKKLKKKGKGRVNVKSRLNPPSRKFTCKVNEDI